MKPIRKLTCLALCALLALTSCAKAALPKPAGEELHILFATDIHYLAPDLFEGSGYFDEVMQSADGKMMHHLPALIEALVAKVLAESPDVLILGGDLTFNGEKQSHTQLAALLQPVANAGIPVLVIPGNHDINQPDAYRWLADDVEQVASVSAVEFWKLYAPLGANGNASRDKGTQSYLYKLREDYWLLMVDTSLYQPGRVEERGRVAEGTQDWLQTQLAAAQAQNAEVLVVMHHNLLQHSALFENGYTISNNGRVAPLLQDGGVQLALSGHMHIQHIAQEGSLTDIATGAFSVYPHYVADIRVDAGGNAAYTAQPLEVEAWAAETGSSNAELLAFSAYSHAYFNRVSLSGVEATLVAQGVPQALVQPMADYARRLNNAYFAGEPHGGSTGDELFGLWLEHCPSSFITYYLKSILAEPGDSRHYSQQGG